MNRTTVSIEQTGKASCISRLYSFYVICVAIQLHPILWTQVRQFGYNLQLKNVKHFSTPESNNPLLCLD